VKLPEGPIAFSKWDEPTDITFKLTSTQWMTSQKLSHGHHTMEFYPKTMRTDLPILQRQDELCQHLLVSVSSR